MPWPAKKARARSRKAAAVAPRSSDELLGVGEPRRVVDGHVDVVPADAAVRGLRLVVGEAPAAAGADARQALGVEVQEVAGTRPAVAHRRLTRLEQAQAVQAAAAQGAVDGRRGEVQCARRCTPARGAA